MNAIEISLAVGVIGAFAAIVGLFSQYSSLVIRFARMELKIDTVWDFQVRRAQSEAVNRGIATMNSPIIISDEAKCWMEPLMGPIIEFYSTIGKKLNDHDLYLEVERRFGERMLREVCIPHKLDQGACLLIAVQAAKAAYAENNEQFKSLAQG